MVLDPNWAYRLKVVLHGHYHDAQAISYYAAAVAGAHADRQLNLADSPDCVVHHASAASILSVHHDPIDHRDCGQRSSLIRPWHRLP